VQIARNENSAKETSKISALGTSSLKRQTLIAFTALQYPNPFKRVGGEGYQDLGIKVHYLSEHCNYQFQLQTIS